MQHKHELFRVQTEKYMQSTKISVGGGAVHVVGSLAPEQEELLRKRAAFVETYCAAKGWSSDASNLSMDQLLEIRDQPGWKNPE